MGSRNAADMALETRKGNVTLWNALLYHLRSNHYPPLPVDLIPVAEQAIDLGNTGAWSAEIEMPEGIQFQHRDKITVSEAIESMHLDSFLSLDEYGYPLN
jgi:hypothetical protein